MVSTKPWVAGILAVALLGPALAVTSQPAEAHGRYGSIPVYSEPVYGAAGPGCSIVRVSGYWHRRTWIRGHWKQICLPPYPRKFAPRFPLGGPECDPRIVGGFASSRPSCDPRIMGGLASPTY